MTHSSARGAHAARPILAPVRCGTARALPVLGQDSPRPPFCLEVPTLAWCLVDRGLGRHPLYPGGHFSVFTCQRCESVSDISPAGEERVRVPFSLGATVWPEPWPELLLSGAQSLDKWRAGLLTRSSPRFPLPPAHTMANKHTGLLGVLEVKVAPPPSSRLP